MLVGRWLWKWLVVTGSAALLVGRGNSLMTEFCSLHFLQGLGAVAGRRCQPLRCAASCELRAAAPRCSGLVAPSGTRGMGNPAAVETLLTCSRGGPGHGTLRWTHASEQAGKALRSQGHHCAHVM